MPDPTHSEPDTPVSPLPPSQAKPLPSRPDPSLTERTPKGEGRGESEGQQDGESQPSTPMQRWGTCCPFDPECHHSFLDSDDLSRWMAKPLTIEDARMVEHGFDPHGLAAHNLVPPDSGSQEAQR